MYDEHVLWEKDSLYKRTPGEANASPGAYILRLFSTACERVPFAQLNAGFGDFEIMR